MHISLERWLNGNPYLIIFLEIIYSTFEKSAQPFQNRCFYVARKRGGNTCFGIIRMRDNIIHKSLTTAAISISFNLDSVTNTSSREWNMKTYHVLSHSALSHALINSTKPTSGSWKIKHKMMNERKVENHNMKFCEEKL